MKYFFILLLLNSFPLRSQNSLNNETYYKSFPIEEMILGEWFLEKIEIVGLNKNDSSSIISLESGKDKIVFNDKTYKTIPGTNASRFYRPSYEFFYRIEKNEHSLLNEIILTNRKGKNAFTSFTVLLYTFETLVIEHFELSSRLGEKYSKTRYHYKRKSNNEPPIIGKWILHDPANFYFHKKDDSTWYTFQYFDEGKEDSLSHLRVKTEIEFKEQNMYSQDVSSNYSYASFGVVDGVYSEGTYIVDAHAKRIYFISNIIQVYEYTFDINHSLKIRYINST